MELLTLPEHLRLSPVFSGVRVTQTLIVCVVLCRSLCVIFIWSIYCLSYFDLRLLMNPLVLSEFSNRNHPAHLLWKESLNSNNKTFHLQFKEFKKIAMHVDRDQEHSLEQVQKYGGVKLRYVCLTHRLTKFNALTIFFFFGTY